jgi:hypothetical protein
VTDTTINAAVVAPQDDGTGVSDGSEDYTSAAFFQLLSKYKGDGSYVGENESGSATLQFANVDTANEQVDVEAGYAYIMDGSHSVQSGAQTTYDTALPNNTPYVVIIPSAATNTTNLQLDTDTVNDLWLAVDPSANDSVYIRHGDGLSAPSDPSIKLGTVDTSSGDTTRANDLANLTTASLTTEKGVFDGRPVVDVTEHGAIGDGSTNDTTAVQDAMTEAKKAAKAPVLYFPATGNASASSTTSADTEYLVDTTGGTISPPAGATIVGAGRDAVAVVSNNADGNFVSIENDGVTLRDLTIDMQSQAGANGGAVSVASASHITVRRTRLLNVGVFFVQLANGQNCYIVNNEMQDCHGRSDGTAGFNGTITMRVDNGNGSADHNLFVGNEISNPNGKSQACIGLATAADNRFRDNHLHDNAQGYRYEDPNGNSNDNKHIGCLIEDMSDRGVKTEYTEPSGTICESLTIRNTDGQGIRARHTDMVVRDCDVLDVNSTAIAVSSQDPDGVTPSGIEIVGGQVRGPSGEGVLSEGNGVLIDGITIDGAGDNGIRVAGGSVERISPRLVKNCQRNGARSAVPADFVGGVYRDNGQNTGVNESDRVAIISTASSDTLIKDNVTSGHPTSVAVNSGSGIRVISNRLPNGIQSAALDRPDVLRDNEPPIPRDVRNGGSTEGNRGYHDGSGSNTVGPAFYGGSGWVSLVDGTSIT